MLYACGIFPNASLKISFIVVASHAFARGREETSCVAESKRKTIDGMRSKSAARNKDVAFVLPASARDDSEAAFMQDYVSELFMFGQQYDSCVKDNSGEIFPGKILVVKDFC